MVELDKETIVKLKCGEIILLRESWNFFYTCVVCNEEVNHIEKFIKHILKVHFLATDEEYLNIINENKVKKEELDSSVNSTELFPCNEEEVYIEEAKDFVSETNVKTESALSLIKSECVEKSEDENLKDVEESEREDGQTICFAEMLPNLVDGVEDNDNEINSSEDYNSGINSNSEVESNTDDESYIVHMENSERFSLHHNDEKQIEEWNLLLQNENSHKADEELEDVNVESKLYNIDDSDAGDHLHKIDSDDESNIGQYYQNIDEDLIEEPFHTKSKANIDKKTSNNNERVTASEDKKLFKHSKRKIISKKKKKLSKSINRRLPLNKYDTQEITIEENDLFDEMEQGSGYTTETIEINDFEITRQDMEPKKKFTCEYCGLKVKERGNFLVHIRRHKGIKNFTCCYCDKAFVAKSELKIHERIHTGERPFKCKICGRCFPTNSSFSQHRKRHTNEKNYFCSTCNKGFYDKRHLNDHIICHTGERAFTCVICNKRLARQKALKEHMKIHSKEKRHVCKYCSKAFAQAAGLWAHIKIHNK